MWRRQRDLNSRAGNSRPTPLAGAPLRPNLGMSPNKKYALVAERVGFEPTVPCGITGFQDLLHKPLGHLSVF